MRKLLLLSFVLVNLCSYAQQLSNKTYSIIFSLDSSDIDLGIADNRKNMTELIGYMNQLARDTTKVVTKINIDSYSSPEGGSTYNKKLSMRRSQSLYDYIAPRTIFDQDLYNIKGTGINWDGLIRMVENSDMDYKSEVLAILRYTPEESWERRDGEKWKVLVDSRNKQLMDLGGGVPYKYMRDNFFPALRTGSAISFFYESSAPIRDTVYVNNPDTTVTKKVELVRVYTPVEKSRSLLFALKTNLLSDIILIPNIELEVPISEHFSANAEFARIWWNRNNSKCWEMQNYGFEGRYWFGDRADMSPLTGLFAGIYFSRSTFDLQLHSDRGMQGEVDYSLGFSGGYSMPLGQHFNLEFSAAVGYVNGTYTKYTVADNELLGGTSLYVKDKTKNMFPIFPTKAKVSLVWLINCNKTKR